MNRIEKFFGGRSEARVRFRHGDFDVVGTGDYVRCAVSGKEIPLASLKYWNVELQEAYAGADMALKRYLELRDSRSQD